jgi:hypothetical protein
MVSEFDMCTLDVGEEADDVVPKVLRLLNIMSVYLFIFFPCLGPMALIAHGRACSTSVLHVTYLSRLCLLLPLVNTPHVWCVWS